MSECQFGGPKAVLVDGTRCCRKKSDIYQGGTLRGVFVLVKFSRGTKDKIGGVVGK